MRNIPRFNTFAAPRAPHFFVILFTMNKTAVLGIIGVIILGGVGVVLANMLSEPAVDSGDIRTTEQVIDVPRSAPPVRENSFTIMTPEEKAAADAARAAAEAAAAALASSTASTTASSTASTTDEAREE